MPTLHGLTLPVSFSWYESIARTINGPWQLCPRQCGCCGGLRPPLPQPAVPHQSRRALCGQPARTSSVPRACQGAAGKEARVRICPAPLTPILWSSDLQGPKVGWTHEEPRPQRLRSLPTGIQQVPMGWAREAGYHCPECLPPLPCHSLPRSSLSPRPRPHLHHSPRTPIQGVPPSPHC